MQLAMISMAAGIATVGLLPALPALVGLPVLVLITVLLAAVAIAQHRSHNPLLAPQMGRLRLYTVAAGFLLGLSWGLYSGYQLLAKQLPASLEGRELWVQGTVVGLPERTARHGTVIMVNCSRCSALICNWRRSPPAPAQSWRPPLWNACG